MIFYDCLELDRSTQRSSHGDYSRKVLVAVTDWTVGSSALYITILRNHEIPYH